MRRFILTALFAALAFVVPASASNVTVLNTDTSTYTKGMVCTVNPEFSTDFENYFRDPSFNTDHNNRYSAVKLANYFEVSMRGDCYKLPASGSGTVSIRDMGETYVVVILMDETAARVYWSITNVAGGIDQVITAP
jgi:hypothetical protein